MDLKQKGDTVDVYDRKNNPNAIYSTYYNDP